MTKWTEQEIRNQIEQGGYKTKKDLSANKALYCAAYRHITDNGKRLIDCLGFTELTKPSGYWFVYENNLTEAMKYEYLCDFKKYGGGAFNAAKEMGWLHKYTWLLKKKTDSGLWDNKEKCREAAAKCKNVKEFWHKYSSACKYSVENGWLDEFYPGRRKKYLTKEYCFERAMLYSTLIDFRDADYSVLSKARKKGWIKDYTWLERGLNYVTDNVYSVYVYINVDNKLVYVGLTSDRHRRDLQHRHSNTPVYKAFNKLGLEIPAPIYYCGDKLFTQKSALLLEDSLVNWFRRIGFNVVNTGKTGLKHGSVGTIGSRVPSKKIIEEAAKYSTLKEFREGNPAMYSLASKRGLLRKLGLEVLVKDLSVWENKNYFVSMAQGCKNINEFAHKKGCGAGYAYIRKNHKEWLSEVFGSRGMKKWSRETCYEEAKKYKSRGEFQNGNVSAYGVARKNGWLDDYIWFISRHEAHSLANKRRYEKKND